MALTPTTIRINNRDIDALDSYWQVFPTLKHQLFEAELRAGYSQLKIAVAEIKPTIFTHPEFVAYTRAVIAHTALLFLSGVGKHKR